MPPSSDIVAPVGAEHNTLYVAIEISRKSWEVGIKSPASERIGLHSLGAADVVGLKDLIEHQQTKAERALGREVRVLCCYEAGYEGFWLVRWLDRTMSVETVVLDPASLLVNRKAKQRKTDRIDARKMVRALLAHDRGDAAVLSRVRIPSVEEEDRKRLLRERRRLVKERTSLTNAVKGLLKLHGIGVNARGEKHFLAIEDGVRESTQSWREVLLGMKQRGFTRPAKLAVGDGALGFWAALSQVYPTTRTQRCWMHKTGNVLNYLPKSGQAKAKQGLHEIWMAETRAKAERAFDEWIERYDDKYPKATACLARDGDELLAFYDFPAAPLDASSNDQRHRIGLRHDPPPYLASQRLRHPPDHALDDLQDGTVRREILAPAPRIPAAREGHRGSPVQRWNRAHRAQQTRRMTNSPYTKFDNSSKQPRLHTSAQPSPPVSLRAPRSKQ